MNDQEFFELLRKSDPRIKKVLTSFNKDYFNWTVQFQVKEPFEKCYVKVGISKIELENFPEVKMYDYFKVLVSRTIDEAICKYSYEMVKEAEEKAKAKAEEELKKQYQEAKTQVFKHIYGGGGLATQEVLDQVQQDINKYLEFQQLAVGTKTQFSAQLPAPQQISMDKAVKLMEAYIEKTKGKFTGEVQPPKPKNYSNAVTNTGFTPGVVDELATIFPELNTVEVNCPICGGSDYSDTIGKVIVHLNDDAHNWTREQIADWLETLDVKLEVKEKQ